MGSDYAATFNHPGLTREQRRPTPAMSRLEDEPPEFPTTPIYARKRKAAGFAGASSVTRMDCSRVLVAALAGLYAKMTARPKNKMNAMNVYALRLARLFA